MGALLHLSLLVQLLMLLAPYTDAAPVSPKRAAGARQKQLLCSWNPSDSTCTPTHGAWKSAAAGSVLPSSPYRRAVLAASARETHCSQHTTAADCAADSQMRCFWSGPANSTSSNVRCGSSDLQELLMFSAKGFLPNITLVPHSMTCPGSPAHTFFECYAFAGRLEACGALEQCMVLEALGSVRNVCVPKSFGQQTLGQVKQTFSDLETLAPAAYGTCSAACWLHQAKACSNRTTQASCTALPYCVFDEEAARKASQGLLVRIAESSSKNDSSFVDIEQQADDDVTAYGSRYLLAKTLKPKPCRHKSQEFSSNNDVDRAAQKVYKRCSAAATQAACLAVTSAATAPRTAQAVFDWGRYEQSNATVKCSVTLRERGV